MSHRKRYGRHETKAPLDEEQSEREKKENHVAIVIAVDLQADEKAPYAMQVREKDCYIIGIDAPSLIQFKGIEEDAGHDQTGWNDDKMRNIEMGRLVKDQSEEIDDTDGRAPAHHAENRKDEPGLVSLVQLIISLFDRSPQHAVHL